MDNTFRFVIPALMGVESTVAYELKKLGLSQVKAENGRVLCAGSDRDLPRLNLNVRTGERVLLVVPVISSVARAQDIAGLAEERTRA